MDDTHLLVNFFRFREIVLLYTLCISLYVGEMDAQDRQGGQASFGEHCGLGSPGLEDVCGCNEGQRQDHFQFSTTIAAVVRENSSTK